MGDAFLSRTNILIKLLTKGEDIKQTDEKIKVTKNDGSKTIPKFYKENNDLIEK